MERSIGLSRLCAEMKLSPAGIPIRPTLLNEISVVVSIVLHVIVDVFGNGRLLSWSVTSCRHICWTGLKKKKKRFEILWLVKTSRLRHCCHDPSILFLHIWKAHSTSTFHLPGRVTSSLRWCPASGGEGIEEVTEVSRLSCQHRFHVLSEACEELGGVECARTVGHGVGSELNRFTSVTTVTPSLLD